MMMHILPDHGGFSLAWLALTALLAATVRAMTGWAFSVVAVPTLSLVFAPLEAVVINVLLALAATAKNLPAIKGQVRREVFMPLLYSGLLGTPLGYLLHQVFAPASLRVMIGVLVLLLSAAMAWLRPRPRPLSAGMLALAGLVSGVLGGAVGIAGPPVALLFLLTATDMEQSRATLGLGLFIVCLVAACAFAFGGQITMPLLVLAAIALPVVMLGDSLGNHLFLRHGRRGALGVSITLTTLVGVSSLARGIAAFLP